MLGVLRRNKNNPLIVVVLGLVVFLMMAFGISVQGVSSEGNAAEVNGDAIKDAENLFRDRYIRIRDVREGPNGAIWFLAQGDGALYRMTPAQ